MRLAHLCPGALQSFPQRGIRLPQRGGALLKFALGAAQVFVDFCLVVQVVGDSAVDLRPLQQREVFLDGLRGVPWLKEYTIESSEIRVPAMS